MTSRTMVSTQASTKSKAPQWENSTWWEKTIDLSKSNPAPRTFQTLLLKKYRLEQLEENKEEGMRSDQANAADIAILRKDIKILEAKLNEQAELVSSDEGED